MIGIPFAWIAKPSMVWWNPQSLSLNVRVGEIMHGGKLTLLCLLVVYNR
jgi:hypothetical protein